MLVKLESRVWGGRPATVDRKASAGERVSWDQMSAGWSTVAVEVPAPYEAGEISEESAKAVETPAPKEAWSASSSARRVSEATALCTGGNCAIQSWGGASSGGCRQKLMGLDRVPAELTELAKPWKWPEAVA